MPLAMLKTLFLQHFDSILLVWDYLKFGFIEPLLRAVIQYIDLFKVYLCLLTCPALVAMGSKERQSSTFLFRAPNPSRPAPSEFSRVLQFAVRIAWIEGPPTIELKSGLATSSRSNSLLVPRVL